MERRWLFADQLGPHFLDARDQPVLIVESRAALRRRPDACPFTAGYWSFLDRHADRFARNPRMARQVTSATRLDDLRQVVAQEKDRGSRPP